MRQLEPIADYADALARRLSFDPELASRIRNEVADHLWQTVDELGVASPDNQQRAIARFGDSDDLAREYVADTLLARSQQAGITIVLAVIVVFLAMGGRVLWYNFTQWEANATVKRLGTIALPIDRCAFLIAIACAALGFGYLVTRRTPADFHTPYRRRLGLWPCIAATIALLTVIGVETVMTFLRITDAPLSPTVAIPALTMIVEIVMVVAVIHRIATAVRYAAIAHALAQQRR